jgi:hypothetical protein
MPIEVFYSYSHKDEDLRDRLETHLSQLQRSGLIVSWHDRRIEPGDEWRNQIDAHVRSAQIVLLLISPDFLASDYCYDVEMKLALERHTNQQAIVIPIIVRPVDWSASPFAHLQALPPNGKAVTLWANRDQAFTETARAIRNIVVRFQQPVSSAEAAPVILTDQIAPKPRVLDAAMPSHIVKDRATELLVLIRLPESIGLSGILANDEEAEARPEDVRAKPFDINFPLGPTGRPEPLKVTIELTSPDFSPPVQHKNLFVPVNADSEVCAFLLTPRRQGTLTVVIELQWEDAQRGYRRLRANCIAEAETGAAKPVMNLVQMPLDVSRPGRAPEFEFTRLRASIPPPAAAAAPIAAAIPPTPAHQSVRAAKSSFLANPLLKAAALVACVIGLGTFWLAQKAPSLATAPPASPPVEAAVPPPIEYDAVAVAFSAANQSLLKQTQGVTAQPLKPEVEAAVKRGQENLLAARMALAKGKPAEAQVHLQAVRASTLYLKGIHTR